MRVSDASKTSSMCLYRIITVELGLVEPMVHPGKKFNQLPRIMTATSGFSGGVQWLDQIVLKDRHSGVGKRSGTEVMLVATFRYKFSTTLDDDGSCSCARVMKVVPSATELPCGGHLIILGQSYTLHHRVLVTHSMHCWVYKPRKLQVAHCETFTKK